MTKTLPRVSLTVRQKVFFALFATSLFVTAFLSLVLEHQLRKSVIEEYTLRYQTISRHLGDAFIQMEKSSEHLLRNAAYNLRDYEAKNGLPSEEEMEAAKQKFQISLFGIADKNGKPLRDTELPVDQRNYSFFDFCPKYKNLITGTLAEEITPILISYNTRSYKFFMLPNLKKDRILGLGVRADYLETMLKNSVASDPNVLSIGLFTPSGHVLGTVDLGANRKTPKTGEVLSLNTKIIPPVGDCCECRTKKLTDANGDYYYNLKTVASLKELSSSLLQIKVKALLAFLVASLISYVVSRLISARLVKPLSELEFGIKKIMQSGDLSKRAPQAGSETGDEISTLTFHFNQMLASLERSQHELEKSVRGKSFAQLASQVAHDVRSPLAALNLVTKDLHQMPEDQCLLLRSAADRISNIANELLHKYKETGDAKIMAEICPLAALLDSIISEKRVENRHRREVILELVIASQATNAYARLHSSDFKRVISNLINNSYEAIRDSGSIRVELSLRGVDRAQVGVFDTGNGIPPEMLEKIRTGVGGSFGKSNGHGLGLSHAREKIAEWEGSLDIDSEAGKWTRIILELPLTSAPDHLLGKLILKKGQSVLILDDDLSIHKIWKTRFSELPTGDGPTSKSFFSAQEFNSAMASGSVDEKSTLFLVDYEIEAESENGLELIVKYGLQSQSILVTSRFEETSIVQSCLSRGIKILPKNLAPLIEISIEKSSDA